MKYLLDTCVVSELIKKRPNRSVLTWLDEQDEFSLCLSVITFGELQKGISKLATTPRRQSLQDWVDQDLAPRFADRILGVDRAVAALWGDLSGRAEKAGKKILVLDGILAATALRHGLVVVTGNVQHFELAEVPAFNPWDQ